MYAHTKLFCWGLCKVLQTQKGSTGKLNWDILTSAQNWSLNVKEEEKAKCKIWVLYGGDYEGGTTLAVTRNRRTLRR
jgi:hypothetical protein